MDTSMNSIEWITLLFNKLTCELQDNDSKGVVSDNKKIHQIYFLIQYQYGEVFEMAFCDYILDIINDWCQIHDDNEDCDDRESETDLTEKVIAKMNPIYLLKLNELYNNTMIQALQMYIEYHAASMLHTSYEDSYHPETKSWLCKTIFPLIKLLYLKDINDVTIALSTITSSFIMNNESSHKYVCNIDKIENSLENYLYSAVARVRTNELFEIIADYPDSLPAIRELRDLTLLLSSSSIDGFENSSFEQTFLGKQFRGTLCRRLLHPGASTSQILDMYVSMIRALRILDSSDLLLNYVAAPVRQYLKKRKDTVQCIVSSLSLGKESELHMELKKGG